MQAVVVHRKGQVDTSPIEFLVRQEGNEAYKSFMRQELFKCPVITGQSSRNSPFQRQLNTDPTGISYNQSAIARSLKQIFGPPADDTSLLATFSSLRQTLNQALDRNVSEEYILVTSPSYLPDCIRGQLRDQLSAAGFNILSRIKNQSILAPTFAPLRRQCSVENHILVIELNKAAVEMALVEEYCQTESTIAYAARMDLGEDALALRVMESRPKETRFDPPNVADLASAQAGLSEAQSYLKPSKTDHAVTSPITKLRDERYQAIQQAIEGFVADSFTRWHSDWYGSLPDTVETVLSGDASKDDFTMASQIITSFSIISNVSLRLLDIHNVSPAQAAAYSAASWGLNFPMLDAPGKEWFKGSDHNDWYEQRSKDAAKFRCEINDGIPVFW